MMPGSAETFIIAELAEPGVEHGAAAEREVGRVADGIRLHAGKQQAGRDDRRDREDPGIPLLAHRLLDVERRATAVLTFVFFLVDLAQRRFDVSGRGSQERDDPHPEDRTRAPEADRSGDARDVARADATGQRHRQRLERRDAALRRLGREQQP
jgi:hypothetical protein